MNRDKPDFEKFGQDVWSSLTSGPIGSRTRRDVEVGLLAAAIYHGLVAADPAAIAACLRITVSRAHGYLTDLALRRPELTDVEAVALLRDEIKGEVTFDNTHLCIPIHDAALRLWIERKASVARLNAGETIRRDLVKLTPRGLGSLLDSSEGLKPPKAALAAVKQQIVDKDIAKELEAHFRKGMSWSEGLQQISAVASLVAAAHSLISGALPG